MHDRCEIEEVTNDTEELMTPEFLFESGIFVSGDRSQLFTEYQLNGSFSGGD